MNINTISYWIAEAVASIVKNQKVFLSGIAIMIVALLFVSFMYILYVSSNMLMESIEDDQGKIVVYLQPDLNDNQIENARNAILGMQGVEGINYISTEEAKEKAVAMLGTIAETGVPNDIYPPSFIVMIENLENAPQLARSMREVDGVGERDSDVSYNEDSELLGKVAITLEVVSITIFILAVVAACFIMMNSIKLMLYSRRKEISIMKYVGASDTFTKAPFVIEGLIISLISALIVIIISGTICDGIAGLSTNAPVFGFLSQLADIIDTLAVILIVVSVGIGTIGSSVSVNKYLDV